MKNYHKVVGVIKDLLEDNNVWYETFEHKPVRTSQEAAQLRQGYTLAQGAKALIVRVKYKNNFDNTIVAGQSIRIKTTTSINRGSQFEKKGRFAMIVVPGDARFDSKKGRKALNTKDIRFATEDEVLEITDGVLPGGVPPFGNLFNIPVYVDEKILENEKIIFNAGDKSYSIGMFSKDYSDIVKPHVVAII